MRRSLGDKRREMGEDDITAVVCEYGNFAETETSASSIVWDSLVVNPDDVPITQAQCDELDRRLGAYRVKPAEGVSWQQVKAGIKQRAKP